MANDENEFMANRGWLKAADDQTDHHNTGSAKDTILNFFGFYCKINTCYYRQNTRNDQDDRDNGGWNGYRIDRNG